MNQEIVKLKKLVILHLYYHELWENIKPYLINLKQISEFDLYVTTTAHNEKLFKEITGLFNAVILTVDNAGADLYPFFYVINSINLDNYDIIYKIHSKRNVKQRRKIKGVNCGLHYWRECMLNDILGSKNIEKRLQDFIDDKNLGASGYAPYLITFSLSESSSLTYSDAVSCSNLKKISSFKYYGGTIFMARAGLFKCLQHKFTIEDFVSDTNERFSEFTYFCEALLGYCIAAQGYDYKKGSRLLKAVLILLSHRITYPLYKFFVNKFILSK